MNQHLNRWALVSMPWFWPYLPSIQLAIVKDLLDEAEVEADTYEFYTDLLDRVGPNLYKALANDSGFAGELVFSQFYFENHSQQWSDRPHLGLASKEMEDDIFRFISPVAENFLNDCFNSVDWGAYGVVAFTLTATQSAASMCLAQRIKKEFPAIRIIFGGTSCAGEMGVALALACPEVDFVVHAEAEVTVPRIVEALRGKTSVAAIPGLTWRSGENVTTNSRAGLHNLRRRRGPLNFDSYFERIKSNGADKWFRPWIPFETSRGCWYGEKVQCTFCGLNEIIGYRSRGAEGVAEELAHYATRYGCDRFFSTDLIMPRDFFTSLLPRIDSEGRDWTIFYEIKSNMRRSEVEQLARSGVRWIQPGIESLDDRVLKIMKKGVTAARNIQILKWSQELGIQASWNFIHGFPNEPADAYFEMASILPKLVHLQPPAGLGDFEVHRFSPYFEHPEDFGIVLHGAHPLYRTVFPISQALLDGLVYRYGYSLRDAPDPRLACAREALRSAVIEWWTARERGAELSYQVTSDGSIRIKDWRSTLQPEYIEVQAEEALLFDFLDEMQPDVTLEERFAQQYPEAHHRMGGSRIVRKAVQEWLEAGLLIKISGYVVGLAVRKSAEVSTSRNLEERHAYA